MLTNIDPHVPNGPRPVAACGLAGLALAMLIPVCTALPADLLNPTAVAIEPVSVAEAQRVFTRMESAIYSEGWRRKKTMREAFHPLRETPLPDGRRFGGWTMVGRFLDGYRIDVEWIPGPSFPLFYFPDRDPREFGGHAAPVSVVEGYMNDQYLTALFFYWGFAALELLMIPIWYAFLRVGTRGPFRGALVHYRGRRVRVQGMAR